MFSLGGGGRANNTTQGGRIDGGVTGTTTAQRRPSVESDWDNASAPFRDDPSAPSVSARFGEQIRGNSEVNDNVFDLNRGGGVNPTTPLGGGYRHRHHHGKSPSSGLRLTKKTRTYRAHPDTWLEPPEPRRIQGWRQPQKRGASELKRTSFKTYSGNGQWGGIRQR